MTRRGLYATPLLRIVKTKSRPSGARYFSPGHGNLRGNPVVLFICTSIRYNDCPMPYGEKESFLLEVLDEQDEFEVDLEKVRSVCERILDNHKIRSGRINVVLVDSDTIRQYNRDFLQHDYQTDVISFPLEDRRNKGHLEGELLVCTEIAKSRAEEFGWTAEEEMLLYVIHGMLHLTGYNDTTAEQQTVMQE
jgi:probable rRNA maturation factor